MLTVSLASSAILKDFRDFHQDCFATNKAMPTILIVNRCLLPDSDGGRTTDESANGHYLSC